MNIEENHTMNHTSDEHGEAGDAEASMNTPAVEADANRETDTHHPDGDGAHAATNPANVDERVMTALRAASEKKAVDPVVLDLRQIASFTDYFLIASGTNARQVQAIADAITETLKRAGTREMRVEGYASAEWVLVDYGDFVVHIFEARARTFFDLERLWRDAQRIPVTPQMLGESPVVMQIIAASEES
jgi:ribosome-associated protein